MRVIDWTEHATVGPRLQPPTGNLDSESTTDVLALFDGLHRSGRTIVLITHDDEVAARAERVVVVRDGRLTEASPRRARAW